MKTITPMKAIKLKCLDCRQKEFDRLLRLNGVLEIIPVQVEIDTQFDTQNTEKLT